MECRAGCAACCIVVSISSPIPGMPAGKRAGLRCVQLTPDNRCAIFGDSRRPAVCASLQPSDEMCGGSIAEVYERLAELERMTGRPA